MSAPIAHTRFISVTRFLDVNPAKEPHEAQGFAFISYDLQRDQFVRWEVVADDDPRAETVIHHGERVS